jgi:hypothetical protein
MALAAVLLGLAVFFWGLGYKLSLYDLPGSASTHLAQAKLLSQKERPPAAQALEQFSPKAPQPPGIVGAIFLLAASYFSTMSIQILSRLLVSHRGARRCDLFLSSVFAFRPPPVSL